MINQYINPLSTKGNIKNSFSINLFNVAFDLRFVVKRISFFINMYFHHGIRRDRGGDF